MGYADKEMLLMRKRSDDTTSQYAECDDDGNLHVVATGTTPVAGTVDVGNFPATQTVDGSVNVGNFPATQPVSISAVIDTHGVQEPRKIGEGYSIISATAKANDVRTFTLTQPTAPISSNFLLYAVNPSPQTMTYKIFNYWTLINGARSSGTLATGTIPACTFNIFSATAWTSCFTDIGGVLTDESGDIADVGASDVPFPFTANNDAIYFGATAPFIGIGGTVGTAGVYDATGVWEYWNGSTWAALVESGVYPAGSYTTPFKLVGGFYYSWTLPQDWAAYDIAGSPLSEFWVRFRISNFTSRTTTPSLTQGWYYLAKNNMSHAFAVNNLFNAGNANLLISLDADNTLGYDFPIFWQVREL